MIGSMKTPLPTEGRMNEGYGMIKAFKPTFTITNRITAGLTRIERARGFLEAATLSERSGCARWDAAH